MKLCNVRRINLYSKGSLLGLRCESEMPIVYALVARDKNVLAECFLQFMLVTCKDTSAGGNFPTVTRILLGKITEQNGKMSYAYDNHVFHYLIDNGIIFLCMADVDVQRRLVFSLLDEIMKLWRQNYTVEMEQNAIAFSLNETFSPILKDRLEYYNTNPSADHITRVRSQIETVKDVMIENIDRILERGEKIELLVDKTELLNQQSFKFVKSTKRLRNTLWYRNVKVYILLVFVLLVMGLIISLLVCGLDYERCKAK
eukprot:gene1386-2667_t